MKSGLENKIGKFLSSIDPRLKIGLVLLIGILLILLSGLGGEKAAEPSGEEERVAEICSLMEGVGECRVMMTYRGESEEVYAVMVLCEGGESPKVREKIISMLSSLYGIGSHRIEIQRLSR